MSALDEGDGMVSPMAERVQMVRRVVAVVVTVTVALDILSVQWSKEGQGHINLL